jgi:hypothetical protein
MNNKTIYRVMEFHRADSFYMSLHVPLKKGEILLVSQTSDKKLWDLQNLRGWWSGNFYIIQDYKNLLHDGLVDGTHTTCFFAVKLRKATKAELILAGY